jgi:hypothetical protein
VVVIDPPLRPEIRTPSESPRRADDPRQPSAAPAVPPAATAAPGRRRPARQTSEAPRPTQPLVSFRAMRGLHVLLGRNRLWDAVAARLESSRTLYRAFSAAEKAAKNQLFGCRMCGQCALPSTAYACPMTCPKQLRNGPCGGVAADGSCEVYPGTRCVWLIAYERAEQDGTVADLRRLQRPIDQRKWGESSWVNYWQGRDEGLWTEGDGLGVRRTELPMLP